MEDEKNLTRISIGIPNEMYSWLEENKDINRSELFRNAVDNIRHRKAKKVPPLMFLASVLGIVFSITLVSIALTPTSMDMYVRGFIGLLGGIMAIATAIAYIREKERIEIGE